MRRQARADLIRDFYKNILVPYTLACIGYLRFFGGWLRKQDLKFLIPTAISILALLIALSTQTHAIGGDAVPTVKNTLKPLKPISDPQISPQSEVQAVYIAPSAPSTCSTGVTTGDYYTDLIIQRESGGNSCATNPIGACGLYQSLPCSKMGCSLYDVACQEAWGQSYIISTYGSSYAAWLHELNFSWY